MSMIATTGPTAQQTDARFNADRDVLARLERSMEHDDSKTETYVTIACVMTSKATGDSWMTGNMGRFVDRHFAARFMDENPEMFKMRDDEDVAWTYGLVMVEDKRVNRRSITVL